MNTKNKKLVKLLLPLAVLLVSDQAFAYRNITCSIGGVTGNPVMQDAGLSVYYTGITADPITATRYNAITSAFTQFNRNPSARTMTGSVYVSGASDGTTSGTVASGTYSGLTGNGKSEIFFAPPTTLRADGTPLVSTGAAASTRILRAYSNGDSRCHITEADIVFNSNIQWQTTNDRTTSYAYGGQNTDLTTVALHEIGHWFGLAHEDRYYNVMGTAHTHLNSYVDSSGVEKLQAYLGEDAANGLVALYGASTNTAKQDLSVTHWERPVGAAGSTGVINGQDAYSIHRRTGLYTATTLSSLLPCALASGAACSGFSERFYRASKGQNIATYFGFENNGLSTKTTQVKYYLSTDKAITSSDTLLLTTNYTFTRDIPDYKSELLTLPSNLTSNAKYYIGVIVDSNNLITELNETNNTAYTAILVN